MSNPIRSILDHFAATLGYVPKRAQIEDTIFRGAYWYVSVGSGPEVCIGKNILTRKMRVNAAGLLARTSMHWGVAYDDVEGYDSAAPVFPTQLAVGTGVTAAKSTDWTMYEPLLDVGGAAVTYYPLTRVLFHTDPDLYSPALPISVSYYFDIPAGELYEGYPAGAVDFQEWALFGPAAPLMLDAPTDPVADQDMLARKVVRLSKISALDLTVRWELRT